MLRYKLKAPVLARSEGGELRTHAVALNDLLREYAASPQRKYPLELGTPSTYHEERTVRAPDGARIRHVPPGGEVRSRFGSLSLKLSQQQNEVVANSTLIIAVDRIEPADYPEFRRFVEQADELLRQRIAFAPESR